MPRRFAGTTIRNVFRAGCNSPPAVGEVAVHDSPREPASASSAGEGQQIRSNAGADGSSDPVRRNAHSPDERRRLRARPCAVRVPHALGALFASWLASYFAGNVHMSKLQIHTHAISAKEVR